MKERPILFTAPMVRALLDGTKTQTRRVMKPQPARIGTTTILEYRGGLYQPEKLPANSNLFNHCPYVRPGDRIWVRETWGVVSNAWGDDGSIIDWTPDRAATSIHEMPFGKGYYSGHVIYAADGDYEWAGDDDGGAEPRTAWHPSIHMPRRASRILLEIVSVRVERLNDCSAADARAEGVAPDQVRQISVFGANDVERAAIHQLACTRPYERLWESINGAGSWAANPWVWVIEFKRVPQHQHE